MGFFSLQELIASGFANSLSSFFRCYVSGPSLSRIWILEKAGGSTQVLESFKILSKTMIMLMNVHGAMTFGGGGSEWCILR